MQEPDELVERVARAIAASDMEDYMEDWRGYDARARAAIAAMREAKPIPLMESAQ